MSQDTTRRETPSVSDYTSTNSSPHRSESNTESEDSVESEWQLPERRTSFSRRRSSNPQPAGRSVSREPIPQHDTYSRSSRPHVHYAMPITQRGPVPSGPRHAPEPSRGYSYGAMPGLAPTAYPSHSVNYPEPVTTRTSVPNSRPRTSNRQASPPRRTSFPNRSTNQQAHQPQNPSQYRNHSQYQNPPYYHNPLQYQNLPHYQNPQFEQYASSYPYGHHFGQYQQPFQHQMRPYFPADPPYVSPRSPDPSQSSGPPSQSSDTLQDPPESTSLDIDKIRVEAQLEIMRAIEHKTKLADEQKELEAKIRREAEEEAQRRFEATAHEQEEAIKNAEMIKIEAERKAREELHAKQRAEIDRERLALVQAKRLEDDLRTKIRREREAEQDIRETMARKNEELESRAMEKMLQRMEEVTSLATRKMLRDLGVENEAVDRLVERSVIRGTGRHKRQASDASARTQSTEEEPTDRQQSPGAHTTLRPHSRSQFAVHTRRHQTVAREQLPEERHEQMPGRSMDNPRAFHRPRRAFQFKPPTIDDSIITTDSESDFTRPEVPPHAPFPPGNSSYTDSETRSRRTDSRHASSCSTKSGNSYGSYDSYSEIDDRRPRSEYYSPPYPPPLQDLADEIIEVLMHRLAEWQGSGTPRSQSSSYFDQPRRGRSFTARSESARGGIPMAKSYSSESTRTIQTDSRDKKVSPSRSAAAAIEEEPFQLQGGLEDGSSSSEAQTRMDSLILATLPDSDTSHEAEDSDDSVAGVKLLTQGVTKRDDAHISSNTEVETPLLDDSIPVGGQMCNLM